MKFMPLLLAAASLAVAGAAQAQTIATTVTATGNYNGSLSSINDGVFPPDYTFYTVDSVSFGPDVVSGPTATFNFDLGGLHLVSGIKAAVDNNDDYSFTFYNGSTLVGTYTYLASDGDVAVSPGGQQNFNTADGTGGPPLFTPLTATNVVVTGLNGDGYYAVGEADFTGTKVPAVPEPATWAMMVMGFGLAGAGLRRRRVARIAIA